MREERDQAAIDKTLKALKSAVESDGNLLSLILDAVKACATLGEICEVLREVFNEYKAGDISQGARNVPIDKLDHIGIAVKSIEEGLEYYRDVLGMEYLGEEEVTEQKVRVAFLRLGESRIELLEPTSSDSPVAKFIEKRGAGIHHIAVLVDDIEAALSGHREAGTRLIDETPRVGAHSRLIAFIHPKSTGGVLLELCQRPTE